VLPGATCPVIFRVGEALEAILKVVIKELCAVLENHFYSIYELVNPHQSTLKYLIRGF
jgi:hypothetical protein